MAHSFFSNGSKENTAAYVMAAPSGIRWNKKEIGNMVPYDGRFDPEPWTEAMYEKAREFNWTDETFITKLGEALVGEAYKWFLSVKDELLEMGTRTEVLKELKSSFDVKLNKEEKFKILRERKQKYNEPVGEYCFELLAIINAVSPSMNERTRLVWLKSGMKTEIAANLAKLPAKKIDNVKSLINKARKIEKKIGETTLAVTGNREIKGQGNEKSESETQKAFHVRNESREDLETSETNNKARDTEVYYMDKQNSNKQPMDKRKWDNSRDKNNSNQGTTYNNHHNKRPNTRGYQGNTFKPYNRSKPFKCHYCGHIGHIQKDCRKLQFDTKNGKVVDGRSHNHDQKQDSQSKKRVYLCNQEDEEYIFIENANGTYTKTLVQEQPNKLQRSDDPVGNSANGPRKNTTA